MTYTPGPWILHNLVDEQGRAMTPGEVGAHIADRIRRTIKDGNGSDKHLFVETEEPNELTICDIGNGPNGMANGQLIIAAPDMLAALLAVERAAQLNNVCNDDPSASLEWMAAADAAVDRTTKVLQRLRDAGVIA